MNDPIARKAAMARYIEALNEGDMEAVVALYADDATIEDPVGTAAVKGKAAIRAFYDEAVKMGVRLSLVAPIRGSHGAAAAMAFIVELPDGGPRIQVIDVMEFNAENRIASMRAYWGQEDVTAPNARLMSHMDVFSREIIQTRICD